MATTACSGNVINLQPGGPGLNAGSNRILAECRDLAARRLREALRDLLQACCDEFGERADNTTLGDERRFLLSLADECRAKGGRLEGCLAAHWAKNFDAGLRKDAAPEASASLLLEDMQIVDYGEMDEELAVKALTNVLRSKCEEELYALGRRFGYLLGREGDGGRNPVAPEVFTSALQAALHECDFDFRRRQELYRCLETHVVAHVAPVYHAVNAQLLKHNVLPNLRRAYGRRAGQAGKAAGVAQTPGDIFATLQQLVGGGKPNAAPPAGGTASGQAPPGTGGFPGFVVPTQVWSTLESIQRALPAGRPAGEGTMPAGGNMLHDFRASEMGQSLGQLDAITVDIVAMLFDMIFDDREIADPIKALVGRLQIPVLKVAMLDRSFFSSKAHPARRLLDVISRAALRWGRQVEHDDPIYLKISEIIERVQNEFRQDTALFESLCDDFEHFLADRESGDSDKLNRAALLVVQRELRELAEMAVDSELRIWLDEPLPRVVADLLDHEWRALLNAVHLDEGPTSDAWRSALDTAADLVDSVRPARDRKRLAGRLPGLLKQLATAFDRLAVDDERRRGLLDGLFALHAGVLRGTEPPPEAAAPPVPEPETEEAPTVTAQALDDGEVTVESISLNTPLPFSGPDPDVADLQRGDWVEFVQPDAGVTRYRLSWISPQRGIFLFTNPASPNARAISPEAMSLQLRRGEARIVPTEPIFDRALVRTLEVLQAA